MEKQLFIQACVPTSETEHECLSQAERAKFTYIVIIWYFNAKLSRGRPGECLVEKYDSSDRNDSGERLASMAKRSPLNDLGILHRKRLLQEETLT